MEESDSSCSDVDQQPEIKEKHHTTNRNESDVSYSDSESDETKEPESLLNVNKPQHIPGKYKPSIKPETEQETKTNGKSSADFVANQKKPDIVAGDASDIQNEEETHASSHLLAEKELDFSQTGIFENSMFVIPSMPMDDSEEQKFGENVVSEEQPLVPPNPSFDSKPNDLTQARNTSSKIRPNPAPRKSKRLSEVNLEDKILLTDELKHPKPLPRTKKKSDQEELLPSPEIEENIQPESTKSEVDFTDIENRTFLEIPSKQETVEESKKDLKTNAEENTDSVQTVDIGSADTETREENHEEYNSYKLETDATLITDSSVKDFTENKDFSESFENVKAESMTDSHKIEDVIDDDGSINVDKENSDSDVAKFENDFPDSDSSNSLNNDLINDLNKSESESDDQFKTPDNQSEDEAHEYFDSHGGLAMDTDTVKKEDEQSSETKESQEDDKNLPYGDKHIEQANKIETNFEESVVMLRKKETGYESISSTVSSIELTDVTLSKDRSLTETEVKPPSIRDRISMYENLKHENDEKLGDRNISRFDKSSSFEVLPRTEGNHSHIETDFCKENLTKEKNEATDTSTSNEEVPKSDNVNESMQSVFIVSNDEIQTERALSTEKKTDVNEEVNNVSDDVESSNKPPPIPPKSELVLESMRTSYLEDPPNIPPNIPPSTSIEEVPKSDNVNESMQSVFIVSNDEIQTERALSTEKKTDVNEEVNNESDDVESSNKPPPIPPKSEMVLESMRTSYLEDPPNIPPNIPPRSLRPEIDSDSKEPADTSLQSGTLKRNMDHVSKDTKETASPSTAEAGLTPESHQDGTQQQHLQPEGPIYQNAQQPQPPAWNQFYYMDQQGNVQFVNPYAFFNPNMNPGMFNQSASMQYYQQPQYFPPHYGAPQGQTPKMNADNDSRQYEEVSQPVRSEQIRSAVNAKQHHSLGTEERAHDEHRKSPNIEKHRAKPGKEHQRSPRGVHRNINDQQQRDLNQQGAHRVEDAKLKKSKSDDPIRERVNKSKPLSSPVRRSVSTPMSSAKPGKRKDKPIRRLNEHDEEDDEVHVYEEVNSTANYYIYFKGINPNTKKENLSNFIEATTKGESESDEVIFNHSRTCALVTVLKNTKPDLKKVKERIQNRGIDGAKPEVYEVEPPKSIAVSFDEDVKNLESLSLYFESRRVADCEVEGDPYESEDGSCFILEFSDPSVVKRVCARQTPYIWEGRKLRVSPYFVCKAGAIWDSELHVVKIPGPVVVTLEPSYLLLLQRECCKELFTKLESGHCLPSFMDKGLQFECTLTPKTPSFRSLVKDWEEASRRIVDTYITENVIERQLKSSAEVWNELSAFFKSEKYGERIDLVASLDDSSFVILLVGFEEIVREVLNEMTKKQNNIEKQLRRKTETITFENLKLKLLEKVGFFEEVKKDTDEMDIYIGNGEITVDGQPDDISKVQIKLYESENNISKSKWGHGFSRDFVDFIKRKLIENITSVLKRNGFVAEWKIDDKDFIVYAYEGVSGHSQVNDYDMLGEDDDTYSNVDSASINAKDLIQSTLFERQENVEDSLVEALTSPEWISFIEKMTEDYEEVAEVEFKETTGNIAIYGMRKEAHDLHVKVKEFIDENSVKEETMKCGTINMRFIKMHKSDLPSTLEKKFEHQKVRIEMKDENVIIRGTKTGIAKTKQEFLLVFNSIISEKYTIQKVAVKNVFRDVRESGTIDVVEKDTGCLIKLPGENETFMLPEIAEDSSDESDDRGQVPGATASRQATARSAPSTTAHRIDKRFKAPNGVIVSLVKGELGQQDGDVIVVTTAPNLNLNSGNACKSVLRAGGQQLQDECKDKYKTDIKFGEIAVIHGGGSLECNRVYLTTLPNWNSENNPRQVLEKVMKDSLELASKHQKHSILFCAMGTGQLKYPTDLVAMLMYQAVIDFDKSNPSSTLKDVRFVLYQKDYFTIKAFEAEEKIRFEGGGERQTFDLKTGNLSIELSVENIAEQKVDGILCSTCPKMDLSRNGACQALLRAGGQSLQDECKSKHGNKLEEGQVVEIGGGKLSCKSLFLTVLPAYRPDAIAVLTKVIQTLLQLAQAKSLKSLALPALGTGNLKYPKDEVCKCMFETVREWAQKNPNSTIKTVRFIMHAKDHSVIQMFKSYLVNAKGRGKRESRHFGQEQAHPFAKRASHVGPHKSMYNAHSEGAQVGKIKLSVFKGDILSQKTDAIVSSVGKDFEFLGAVANELKTKFPKMEAKCHKKEKIKMLHKDGVVPTKGYGLPAKKVIHVQFAEHLSDWQKRIYKCLETVNSNAFRTVAFPVLGTGKGFTSFNPEAIAGCMFDAISEFVQAYKNHTIREVRLIVYKGQPTMFDPIMNKLHKKVQEAASSASEGTAKKFISKTIKKLKIIVTGKEDGVMSAEDKKKLLDMTSSMDVIIYSDSKTNIDNCKKELDAKLEKIYTKRKIEDWKELIKSLTQEESEMLDIVALANIKVDSQAGIITIEGPMKQVSDVYDELYTNLLKIQRRRHEVTAADELFKIVQWQYEEVTQTELKLMPYNKSLNQQIEKAYKNNETEFEFEDDSGDMFVIDFSQLIEYRKSDKTDSLKVLRKDILKAAASALPEDWAQMKDNENIKVVALPTTDQTYIDIEQRFITEVKTGSYTNRLNFDPNNVKVNKIERIQNKTLYQQYQAKKKQMTEQKPNLPANMPIEKELWHGTKFDAVTSIQMHGFNRSYSGNANGQPWYGDGVYFAANASYSARGWLSGAGAGSKGYMFLVKTLTGQFVKGQQGMRYLPAVDPKDPTLLYDCAVDNTANPMEFVIFNDTQAYPAYIISFTT